MRFQRLLLGGSAVIVLGGLGACTTPSAHSGLLSDYSQLGEVQGRLGKRTERRPVTLLPTTSPLVLETVAYAPGVRDASRLSDPAAALLLNHFVRELCGQMSPAFEITPVAAADGYRLRAWVTEVQVTGMVGAAVSTPLSVILPVGGRLPVGLGAFAAEVEVVDATGNQVAAMVWRRRADMTMEVSLSRISDAYALSEEAAEAFGRIFQSEDTNQIVAGVRSMSPIRLKGRTDAACAPYGEPRQLIGDVFSIFAPPLPPEVLDQGAARD